MLRRFLVPLIWTLLIVAGLTMVLVLSETAREVTLDSLKLVFTLVTTPFILETTVASLFLLGLLAYNRWRLHKEGDGWVYLMTQEAGEGSSAQTHSMILAEKPEPVDAERDEAGVIEGYLELGLAAQALEELRKDGDRSSTLDMTLLSIRVLAANLETEAALALQRDMAARQPEAQDRLGRNAGLIAAWMREHLPTHAAEAAFWQQEAGKIAVA